MLVAELVTELVGTLEEGIIGIQKIVLMKNPDK